MSSNKSSNSYDIECTYEDAKIPVPSPGAGDKIIQIDISYDMINKDGLPRKDWISTCDEHKNVPESHMTGSGSESELITQEIKKMAGGESISSRLDTRLPLLGESVTSTLKQQPPSPQIVSINKKFEMYRNSNYIFKEDPLVLRPDVVKLAMGNCISQKDSQK
jgi:hypothetical protein